MPLATPGSVENGTQVSPRSKEAIFFAFSHVLRVLADRQRASSLSRAVELVFDELRQAGAGCLFDLGEKALRMLLHQAVQRGLLGAVALVVDRGAIAMRPAGLGGVGLLALEMGSLGRCSFSRRPIQRIRHWGDILAQRVRRVAPRATISS